MGRKLLYIALILFAAGCKKEQMNDCFTSAGKETTISRALDDFTILEAGNKFDVELIHTSNAPSVSITCGGNLLPEIRTTVKDGKLTITNENTCNFVRKLTSRIKVKVYYNTIENITARGACAITNTDTLQSFNLHITQLSTQPIRLKLDITNLEIAHREVGEISLSGYAAVFVPVIYDAGRLDARELTGDYIFVYHYGLNEVHVTPYKVLHAHIGNTGSVYYYADPVEELKEFSKGPGSLLRKP